MEHAVEERRCFKPEPHDPHLHRGLDPAKYHTQLETETGPVYQCNGRGDLPHEMYVVQGLTEAAEVERHATRAVSRGEHVVVHYHKHGFECRQSEGGTVGTGCKDWNVHLALLAEAEAKKAAAK